jgi:APA family basic amino acid/polyamine antiporter
VTAAAVVVGTVIGSGIFRKPPIIAQNVPNFGLVLLVWVLGGILALLGALALAEVAVLFPRAGGNYVFLREGYGRLFGFLWGWVEFWIIRTGSIAALATVFTESLHDLLRGVAGTSADQLSFWQERMLTIGVIACLALVNIRGVRWGGVLQLFITLVKVFSLLGIVVLPFFFLDETGEGGTVPATAAPSLFSWGGLGTALLGVLWAYHGWMNLAPVAEEVKNPQRNLPFAFLAGVGTVIALYLSVNLAYQMVIPLDQMAALPGNTTAAAVFSMRLLHSLGAVIASGAVMCSVFGALNGNLLVGPRLLYAMGEDRLAPRALGAIHPTFRTPAWAIAVMAGWAILLILSVAMGTRAGWLDPAKSHFDTLTDFAMFGAVIFETLAVTTIFVFRRRLPDAPRPYRCWGYPLVPALYLVLPAMILCNMFARQQAEAAVGVGFIAVGAIVYVLFFRR